MAAMYALNNIPAMLISKAIAAANTRDAYSRLTVVPNTGGNQATLRPPQPGQNVELLMTIMSRIPGEFAEHQKINGRGFMVSESALFLAHLLRLRRVPETNANSNALAANRHTIESQWSTEYGFTIPTGLNDMYERVGGSKQGNKWVSTKRIVATGRAGTKKTVYRNSSTGDVRVRKLVSRPDGSKRYAYVKF
jgi:hypothetical protein